MASEEMLQAINKHAMGDRSEFDALKERFTSTHYMSCPAAAALGYLIAKDELEAKKEEEGEEPDVYDEVVGLLDEFGDLELSTHAVVDQIFTLIYEWLDEGLAEKYFASWGAFRTDVKDLFKPFIIEK